MSISSNAAAAREAARKPGGKFGEQPHSENEVDLTEAHQASPGRMRLTTSRGVPFTVRYVSAGESYGATRALVADEDMVEFYDARAHDFGEHGQFVSRYDVDTLRGEPGLTDNGLSLYGRERDWQVDGDSMRRVLDWIHETERPSVEGPALEVARARGVEVDSFGGVMNGDWYNESSAVADSLNEDYRARGVPTVHMEEGAWGDEDQLYMRVVDTDGKTLGISSMDWKDLADEDPDTTGEDAFREYARALDGERAHLLKP